MLPGQQILTTSTGQQVSSYIFGSNMSPDYSPKTSRNTPQIQALIKQAGITLMRCAIPHTLNGNPTPDSYIDLTASAVAACGAQMLVILDFSGGLTWCQHIVSYLGSRCSLYEFRNEPDLGGISWQQYLSDWNTVIPALRAINPGAAYIGPVLGVFGNLQGYLVPWLAGCKASSNLPDCVSYHVYPCTGSQWTAQTCMPRATAFQSAAQKVDAAVQGVLGHTLPQALTEWNVDAASPVHSFATDPSFVPAWTKQAIDSMVSAGIAIACQWDAGAGAAGGADDLISVSNFQPNANGQYGAMVERIQHYLGGGGPVPPPPPPASGSTFYLTAAKSSVLPTANQLYTAQNSGTPPNTWVYNRVGTALGYGELTSQGSAGPWPALSAIGAPTGKGFILDSSLVGQMFLSGSWSDKVRLNCASNGDANPQSGSLMADITARAFNFNARTGTYTPIMSTKLAGVTIPAPYTTFSLPVVGELGMSFGTDEYLYLDYWPNITANTNNNPLLDIRLNRESTDTTGKTGDSNTLLSAPALQPSTTPPVPPTPPTVTLSGTGLAAGTYPATVDFSIGSMPESVSVTLTITS